MEGRQLVIAQPARALIVAACLAAACSTAAMAQPAIPFQRRPQATSGASQPGRAEPRTAIRHVLPQATAPRSSASQQPQPFEPPRPVAWVAQQPEAIPTYQVPLSGLPDLDNLQITNRDGRITLIARAAHLDDVLSLLAKEANFNLVLSDDLALPITMKLTDVSIGQALQSVLAIANATAFERDGILFVTTLESARAISPEIQDRQLEVIELDYTSAAAVQEAVVGFLSPVGQVFTYQVNQGDNRMTKEAVVVEDVPVYLNRIRHYIRQIDVPPRQVIIEAHVLQIDLSDDKRHGVNYRQALSMANSVVELDVTGFANPLAPQALFFRIDGTQVDALVEAVKTTTDAKTLASPNVLVLNGQEARIQIGQQLGFRVTTTTETSTLESVDFLDVGVVLRVTPRISRDGRVMMRVKPEVSKGAVNPDTGLPEEETTEVETDVMLASGTGVVIGGLIQETDSVIQSKVPWLGDLYLIGWMFQRSTVLKSRQEILITLVPRIVEDPPLGNPEAMLRTETPLFHGPLQRVPRPWEAVLPDAERNPTIMRLPPVLRRHHCYSGQPATELEPPLEQVPSHDPRQGPMDRERPAATTGMLDLRSDSARYK